MLSPFMLLGLLGLSIPIAIHLIQKQRLKPQPLATLQFLDAEDVANAFAPVPRDVLQLILRLILLLIMVLLLTRLTLPSAAPGPRTMVLILDQSMSMKQLTAGNRTLYQQMKSQVTELVQQMQPGDRVSLQFVGDRVTSTDFLDDKEELLRLLDDTAVSDCGALALMPTIRESVNLLRSRHDINPSVLVFSDHQALNYAAYLQDAEVATSATFRKRLTDSRVKLLFIDPQNVVTENVGIEDAVFSTPDAYLGASAALTVTAKNYGTQSKTVNLLFHEGATDAATRELVLEPGETAQMDLIHSFENPIDTACRVSIDNDPLPGDNEFHLPMRMKDRTQILLVTQAALDEKDGKDRNHYRGADLLAYALNPGEALGNGTGTFINVKKVTPNLLSKQSLPLYAMIVLYGVADLDELSRKDLTAFVHNGGGLMIILESTLSPASVRNGLTEFLGGIEVGQIKEGEKVQGLNRNENQLDNQLLFPLIHGDWGELDTITVNSYFDLKNTEKSSVLLRAEIGDPLIVTHSLGSGRIIIQAVDCELTSSSLPRTAAFVSICQELSSYLTGNGPDRQTETMRAGDVLRVETPEFRGLAGDIRIEGPDHFTAPIATGEESIQFSQAVKAGAYTLSDPRKKSGRKHWVTVNPVKGEANLEVMDKDSLLGLFSDHAAFIPYSELPQHFQNRHEILTVMVLLLFIAFAIEALTGAWFSRSQKTTGAS